MVKLELWQSGVPGENWGAHQSKLSAHFLQSRSWGLFQQKLGHAVFHASGANWSWLAYLESNRFGSRLYAPYGPTASSPESLKKALAALQDCARAQKADFIRIEPIAPYAKKTLKLLHARHAHRDIQPRHTLVKDLNRPDEELYAEMMSTNRRLYRRAAETGFTFHTSYDPADLSLFLKLTHELAERTGIKTHSDNYYKTMAETLFPLKSAALVTAKHNGNPLATTLIFEDSTTRYYAHAAASSAARKLQPGVYLLGHLIFDGKAHGKHRLDYCGVSPPGVKQHRLAGVSQFKRSFGGQEVEYSGTWEIPIKKARYITYRLFTKMRQAKHRRKK